MARAEKKPAGDFEVVLTLSKEEAIYLFSLTGGVGGFGGLSKINIRIFEALNQVIDLSEFVHVWKEPSYPRLLKGE